MTKLMAENYRDLNNYYIRSLPSTHTLVIICQNLTLSIIILPLFVIICLKDILTGYGVGGLPYNIFSYCVLPLMHGPALLLHSVLSLNTPPNTTNTTTNTTKNRRNTTNNRTSSSRSRKRKRRILTHMFDDTGTTSNR